MSKLVLAIAGIVLVGILVWWIWRLSSRRRELPCPVWLRWLVELDNPFTKTNRAAVIVGLLDLRPGMKALDAGCGPGRLTVPLARAAGPDGQVLAVDIQAGMLQRARERVAAAGVKNVQFLQAGLGEEKLPSGEFDRAVLVTVLGEIPDQAGAMRELAAALKPDGILSVTEVIFDPHFQRREAVVQLAEAAGFKENGFFGRRLAYTLHLKKSSASPVA